MRARRFGCVLRRLGLIAALLLIPLTASAQDDVAVLTSVAPIDAHPKVTREPLRVAGTGSTLMVVRQQGDWIEVRFEDRQCGKRSGWVQRSHIKLHEEVTVTASAGAANNLAVVTSIAPIYLRSKVTQEPLRVVAAGSTLAVGRHRGDWTEVAFQDPQTLPGTTIRDYSKPGWRIK